MAYQMVIYFTISKSWESQFWGIFWHFVPSNRHRLSLTDLKFSERLLLNKFKKILKKHDDSAIFALVALLQKSFFSKSFSIIKSNLPSEDDVTEQILLDICIQIFKNVIGFGVALPYF